MVGMDSPLQGVEIVERALAASGDADPVLVSHIEAHMVNLARFALDSRRVTFDRAARLRSGVERGELEGAMELTVAATEVMMAGESSERAAALAERAIEALRADPILAVVVGFASHSLIVADRLDDADRILSATRRRRQAAPSQLPRRAVAHLPLRSALPRGGPPRSRRATPRRG